MKDLDMDDVISDIIDKIKWWSVHGRSDFVVVHEVDHANFFHGRNITTNVCWSSALVSVACTNTVWDWGTWHGQSF